MTTIDTVVYDYQVNRVGSLEIHIPPVTGGFSSVGHRVVVVDTVYVSVHSTGSSTVPAGSGLLGGLLVG